MKKIRFIALFVLTAIAVQTFGQDKIQLMNGKVLRGKLGTEYDGYYDFDFYKNGGKVKSMELTKYRMFSYTNSSGEETILYRQDTLMGNFFTPNEMKMFVYGERDAFNNFKSTGWFLTGLGLGFGAAILDTYDFQGNGGFFAISPSIVPIAVPFVVTIGAGLFKTKVRKEYAADVNFLASEHYIEGFQKITKVKKLKNALFGSIIGVGSGLLLYSIAK